jgi:hypothetical protein
MDAALVNLGERSVESGLILFRIRCFIMPSITSFQQSPHRICRNWLAGLMQPALISVKGLCCRV